MADDFKRLAPGNRPLHRRLDVFVVLRLISVGHDRTLNDWAWTRSGSPGCRTTRSKPRNIRKWKLSTAHVHAAQFGAPGQRRENLAGIEQPLVVEGAFEALLLVKIGLREHHRHEVALFGPNAVFAGENAADFHA